MCSVLERTKINHEEKLKSFNSSHILKIGVQQRWGATAISIHPAPPADHLLPPHGFAGPLPVRHPQPALLLPKKKRREKKKKWGHKQLNISVSGVSSEAKHTWLHRKTEFFIHFNRTITSTWLKHQGEKKGTKIHIMLLMYTAAKTFLNHGN